MVFLRLLAGFWYLCLAYMLTVLAKVLLNVMYGSFTYSLFHAHLVVYDSDPGDTMIVVTCGFSFENLPLQHVLRLNSEVLYPGL